MNTLNLADLLPLASVWTGLPYKRDYYLVSTQGRRRVQLAIGPQTLAFVGASDKESIASIKELAEQCGPHSGWQLVWLKERGALPLDPHKEEL